MSESRPWTECPYWQPALDEGGNADSGGWIRCVLRGGHRGSHRPDWYARRFQRKGQRWRVRPELTYSTAATTTDVTVTAPAVIR